MPPLARRIPIPTRSLLTPTVSARLHLSLRTQFSRSLPAASAVTYTQVQFQQRRFVGDHASDHAEHHGEHDSHYDEPGGWLWGIRPGEKYEKEGWEYLMWYGFTGSWIIAIIAYACKEDTTIQTWALEEARRRLEKEGILEDPSPDGVVPLLEEKK